MNLATQLATHPLIETIAWVLLHFVWQGALIGFATYFLLRVVRPAAASTRYLIGVSALAVLLATPIATFVVLLDEPGSRTTHAIFDTRPPAVSGAHVTGTMYAELAADPSATRRLMPAGGTVSLRVSDQASPAWLPLVTGLWLVGVVVLSLRLLGGWVVTRMLARRAVASVAPHIERAAREIAARLRLPRGVAVLESAAVTTPTLIGWVRPVVLLPASALAGLSPMQLEAILAHELAHVRRHDYLVNLLQSFVETLLFYHPAVWWISADVRAERENCCDDLAVAVCGDRLVYVSALAELTSLERRALALAATDGSLLTRVRRLLGRQAASPRELPPTWSVLAVVAVLGGGAGTYEITSAAADQTPPDMHAVAGRSHEADAADAKRILQAAEDRYLDAQRALESAQTAAARESARRQTADSSPSPGAAEQLRAAEAAYAAAARRVLEAEAEVTQAAERHEELAARDPVSPTHPEQPIPPAPPAPLPPHDVPMAPPAPDPLPQNIPQTPPAAPAAPAAPAPPAVPDLPPQGETMRQSNHGNFTWSHNGDRLSVKWTGPFRLTDDERDIAWIEDGATLTISDGWVLADRVELRGVSGGIERSYYRNGSRRDFDDDARRFLAAALQRMIRSGMFAAERVGRLLRQGGPEAVVAEVDRLQSDSSYVKRVYYTELLKQADPPSPIVNRILERVANAMKSDYDRATVLVRVLDEPALGADERGGVARTARSLGSDYEKRKVLSAVLAKGTLTDAIVAASLDGAGAINSAYDRAIVLGELARRGAVGPSSSATFMSSVGSMSSAYEQRKVLAALAGASSLPETVALDAVRAAGTIASSHDRRQTLTAYLARPDVSPRVAAAALASAASMSSSHDKAEVLLDVIRRGSVSDQTAAAFFAAAGTLGGSHDLSRVLRALAARPNQTDVVVSGLVSAAATISGSYERANTLLDILRSQTLSPAARQQLIAAAESIGSSSDRNRVLAELVRTERRGR